MIFIIKNVDEAIVPKKYISGRTYKGGILIWQILFLKKLRVHNFLSFGDAEVEFRDKGYTLVSGVNLNPKDGALSNGSGKSSIWSAISWALTGETIQGINTNVCHINFLTEGCWVELTFKLDKDVYKITRYRDFW